MSDIDKMALLPCPFCGSPDVKLVTILDADGDVLHAVGCPKCGCNGTPHIAAMDDPRQAAAAAWNKRAPLTAPPGYVLVPVEPTPRMSAAGFCADEGHDPAGVYRAMIAAAPEPKT